MTRREWEIIGVILLIVFVVPIVAVLKLAQYIWWSTFGEPS